MTQPPDDRPRPDQPGGDGGPENEPTVAWTPPEPEPEKPAAEGGPGDAAQPPTPDAPPPAGDVPPAAAAGPIISATPTPPASGWEQPSQGAVTPPVAPTGGWEVPAAAAAAPQQDGYVIAGVGARFVAWLIDITIAGIVPAALSLVLIDWSRIITDALEQLQAEPAGVAHRHRVALARDGARADARLLPDHVHDRGREDHVAPRQRLGLLRRQERAQPE